jgi:RHS repeat-associated protein
MVLALSALIIIAGKDKTQVQQKRYRYTGKEKDDRSGLPYYGARYLAPWMALNNFF